MSDNTKKIELEYLGYNAFFESNWKNLELGDCLVARVVAEYKEAYRVKNTNHEYLAKITGKQMFNALSRQDYPAVGDWVAITELDEERVVIRKILPRRTILRKKCSNKQEAQVIATNVDEAFIIESVDRDYNLNRFERYFVLAQEGNITPSIILNKIDLISQEELNLKISQIKSRFKSIDVIPTSVITKEGLDKLTAHIAKGKTYCFLGSSGVGKSSLINKLLGTNAININEISHHTGRGRHTTTRREIYFLENGGIVIDNPGTREIGMMDSIVGIENVFDEVAVLSRKCRFSNCTHTHEPGCAVLNAIESNELDGENYSNYVKLKKEAVHYEMTEYEKRRKDRQFGKFIKKTLKQLKEYNH